MAKCDAGEKIQNNSMQVTCTIFNSANVKLQCKLVAYTMHIYTKRQTNEKFIVCILCDKKQKQKKKIIVLVVRLFIIISSSRSSNNAMRIRSLVCRISVHTNLHHRPIAWYDK